MILKLIAGLALLFTVVRILVRRKARRPGAPLPPSTTESHREPYIRDARFDKKNGADRGGGCIGRIILALLLIAATLYIAVIHTPLPFLAIQAVLNSSDSIMVKGVGGSLASGFKAEEIRLTDTLGHESQFRGVVYRHNGIVDIFLNNRLIIKQFLIESAVISLSGKDESEPAEPETLTGPDREDGAKGRKDEDEPFLFELNELDFSNIIIREPESGLETRIDNLSLSGVKIHGDEFELTGFSLSGDHFEAGLVPRATETKELVGNPQTYEISGVVKPALHDWVLAEVPFLANLHVTDAGADFTATLFNGELELAVNKDGSISADCEDLTVSKYLSPDAVFLPDRFSIRIDSNSVRGGQFWLEGTRFVIPAQEITPTGENGSQVRIRSSAIKDGKAFDAVITVHEDFPVCTLQLEPLENSTPRDTLSRLMYGVGFSRLSPAQVRTVESGLKIYFKEIQPTGNDKAEPGPITVPATVYGSEDPGETDQGKSMVQTRETPVPQAQKLTTPPIGNVTVERSFQAPSGTQPSGLTWDGDKLWMSSYMKEGGIYRIDPSNGQILEKHSLPITRYGGYGGLAHDGICLWHNSSYGDQLVRIRYPDMGVIKKFPSPDTAPRDLAWDGSGLWVFSYPSRKMYRFDPERETYTEKTLEVDTSGFQNAGLTYDGSHLWLSSGRMIYRIKPEDGKVVMSARLPHSRTESLAWDGEQLWAASFDKGIIYRIKIDKQ